MTSDNRIAIPSTESYEFVKLSEIVRFEGLQNYTRVFLKNGKMIIATINIGHIAKTLQYHGFVSCHKSHLINMACIERFMKEGYCEMMDGSSVPVSRRKKMQFIEQVVEQRLLGHVHEKSKPIIKNINRM